MRLQMFINRLLMKISRNGSESKSIVIIVTMKMTMLTRQKKKKIYREQLAFITKQKRKTRYVYKPSDRLLPQELLLTRQMTAENNF